MATSNPFASSPATPVGFDDTFDQSLNLDYHERFNNQSSLISNIAGGSVAAVADFGASVWNSLPGTPEVATADILARINDNALRVYEENTEAIEMISLIGGSFVPGAIALKGMGAMRAGVKGANWFSKQGRLNEASKLEELFLQGPTATKEYRSARNAFYARGMANQALDTVAMEAAIVFSMNAHPLMEDYMADPVKNFAISAAFGGVLGAGMGAIGDNFFLKSVVGKAESAAYGTVFNEMRTAFPSTANATQLQIYEANIDGLKKIVDPEATYNELTKQIASKTLLEMQKQQKELFLEMASPEIRALPTDVLENLQRHFASSDGTWGVENVKFLTQKEEGKGKVFGASRSFINEPDFTPVQTKDAAGNVISESIPDVVFYPEFNRYASPVDAAHYTRARDLGKTIEQMDKELGKNFGLVPNNDFAEELLSLNSATLDGKYLAALSRVDKMDASALGKLAISPEDMPMMNALLARAVKEPEIFKDLKFTVTSQQPNYGVMEQAIVRQGNVKEGHFSELHKLTAREGKYNLSNSKSLSSEAHTMLADWTSGHREDIGKFRKNIEQYLRGDTDLMDGDTAQAIRTIMDSPERAALQKAMMAQADAEGNVYLWRGISKGRAQGHSSVESFTPSFKIAETFGHTPRLYKVHVEDVLGTVTGQYYDGAEILVLSPTRQVEASLPISSATPALAKMSTSTAEAATIQDISAKLLAQKESVINDMLNQGIPIETIAIRTNTPLDTIQSYATLPPGSSLVDAGTTSSYNSMLDIDEYMSPSMRALQLSSNVRKKNYAEIRAGVDNKTAGDIDRTLKEVFLRTSNSKAANMLADTLFGEWKASIDILRSEVNNFVNSKAGNRFFTSTDFYARDMGDAGKIAAAIGKNVQQVSNDIERSILEPIKNLMSTIVKSPEALTEANVALQLNASLKGYRVYNDGKFWQMQKTFNELGEEMEQLMPVNFQGKEFSVVSPDVNLLLLRMQDQGKELYNLKNAGNKILGTPDMSDLGFWVPALDPRNKYIAYVHDDITDSTKMLWANTDTELQELVRSYRATVPAERLDKDIKIILPSDREAYNVLKGRNDALTMEVANAEMQKTGSNSAALIKSTADIFSEIAGGYEHYIGSQVRRTAEMAMSDVIDVLDRMSTVNQAYFKNQPLGPVARLVKQPKDAANVMKNTLLGNSNLNEYTSWKSANQSFETGLSFGMGIVNKAWDSAIAPFTKTLTGKRKDLTTDAMQKMDYKAFAESLESKGIHNPWAIYDDEAAKLFNLSKIIDSKDSSARLIHSSNAFAATVALRVGELAQPLINIMSLPILTSLAAANNMPATFLGKTLATSKVSGTQIMYEGMRASNDPKFAALGKRWEELGYFKPMISEANETLKLARGFDKGLIPTVEKALDSNLVSIMSKPADWSETFVRRQTMYTGAVLAKRLYPELDDVGVTIFARDFMDKSVGNYHAAQRPVFFQGTAGVALGLFQTYMLTMGQNIYRGLELKNYKALGKAALTQSTIFGIGSMPGFHPISEAIGEHFSDNNIDLVTGTYRAFGDNGVTDALVYGLPSSIGPAFHTRGEISPRFPNLLNTGVGDVVGVNFAMQAAASVRHVVDALGEGYPEVGQALLEALSMQSMSRPLARTAELASGYSITQKGNTVATPEEIWTPVGVMSRILSVRPLEEAKLRQAMHLNSYYGTIDREARQELMGEIKTALRNGTLDEATVARVSEAYFRKGGSPTGWRSAYNTAIAQTNINGKAALVAKLDPDSPLNYMIENLD